MGETTTIRRDATHWSKTECYDAFMDGVANGRGFARSELSKERVAWAIEQAVIEMGHVDISGSRFHPPYDVDPDARGDVMQLTEILLRILDEHP